MRVHLGCGARRNFEILIMFVAQIIAISACHDYLYNIAQYIGFEHKEPTPTQIKVVRESDYFPPTILHLCSPCCTILDYSNIYRQLFAHTKPFCCLFVPCTNSIRNPLTSYVRTNATSPAGLKMLLYSRFRKFNFKINFKIAFFVVLYLRCFSLLAMQL